MKKRPRRWDPCVYHRGSEASEFLRRYLACDDRHVFFVGAAGFDPRSTRICEIVAHAAQQRIQGLLLREERPGPPASLERRADDNCKRMQVVLPDSEVKHVQIFASDNAVIGGRRAVLCVSAIPAGTTDVFVDVSAMSIGVSFPLIKQILNLAETDGTHSCNVHVVVCDEPTTDNAIEAVRCDRASPIHTFQGGWGLDDRDRAATLWMPQLSRGKQTVLDQIFQVLRNAQPDTVICPILPFPASNPRLADELLEEYAEQLQQSWQIDARDLVFAHEKSPLDLYRTILRIDDARSRVFADVGGSQIVLSPLGSKALSLGALMAAIERSFTVMYVEALGYTMANDNPELATDPEEDLVHIWLHGDAYKPRIQDGSSDATL
jgi:hypothetical protein